MAELSDTLRNRASCIPQTKSDYDAHSPASHSDRVPILPDIALGELKLRRQRCTAMLYTARLSPHKIPSVAGRQAIDKHLLSTVHAAKPGYARRGPPSSQRPRMARTERPHRHQPRRHRRQGLRWELRLSHQIPPGTMSKLARPGFIDSHGSIAGWVST